MAPKPCKMIAVPFDWENHHYEPQYYQCVIPYCPCHNPKGLLHLRWKKISPIGIVSYVTRFDTGMQLAMQEAKVPMFAPKKRVRKSRSKVMQSALS
jgi:hypothetical protein